MAAFDLIVRNAFNAFNATNVSASTVGVKGSDVYTTSGDPRVDLSVILNRGLEATEIQNGMRAILALGTEEANQDAVVLAFQTRNIRGGKGERDLSRHMFMYLLEARPTLMQTHMLELIPQFGCWRDLFILAADSSCSAETKKVILQITMNQLKKDLATPEGEAISLCAKWAPREGKANEALACSLANLLFPTVEKGSERLRQYRKMVVLLNKRVKTTEIKMCANDWEEIVPNEVPGRCLQKHRKAFLNEKVLRDGSGGNDDSTLRHPTNDVRMACREHFVDYFAKAAAGKLTLKAANVIYPHEVIANVLSAADSSVDEKNLLRGQWRSIVEKAREGGALTKCLAMCDFSGSMSGTPLLISTALGLLVSQLNGTNKILTFDSKPQWHTFPEGEDVFEKVRSISNSLGQGLSTDFQAAMEMILADIKLRRLRPEDIPTDLIVFTDMGWDQACNSAQVSPYTAGRYRHVVKTAPWQTHIEMIRESFKRAGEDMWGVPFQPPRIVIWNLREEFKEFHATADQEGVIMLSGWSPALFKILQQKGISAMTPMEALRCQLDDPMYEEIRKRVSLWWRGV